MMAEHRQLALGLRKRPAWLESAHDMHWMCRSIPQISGRILPYRRVYIRLVAEQLEPCRSDTHNGIALAVKDNWGTDSVPPGEVTLPKTTAQDCYRRCTLAVFFGQKAASLHNGHTQNGKQARRNLAKIDIFGLSRLADCASGIQRRGNCQRTALASTVNEIQICDILFAKNFCIPPV